VPALQLAICKALSSNYSVTKKKEKKRFIACRNAGGLLLLSMFYLFLLS
jgi:hypothetical protein